MSNWKTDRLRAAGPSEWTQVEDYSNSFLIQKDDALEEVQRNEREHGLPDIAVAPSQGKFLYLLAKSLGVKRCIEVGTLGGYLFLPYVCVDALI